MIRKLKSKNLLNSLMRISFFFLFAAFLLSTSCRKTQLGEYYFRCKVNDQLYLPDGWPCANCMRADLLGDTILIVWGNNGYESVGVSLHNLDGISKAPRPFEQTLNETSNTLQYHKGGGGLYSNEPYLINEFRTDSIHTGKLIIESLDKQSMIIKGRFSFQAYNASKNAVVNISEGLFRLEYNDH